MEFSAKALLILAGYDFPKSHNVGRGLELVWRSIAGTKHGQVLLAKRQIARVGWLCDVVAPLQSISEYGFAEKRASLLVNARDAQTFYKYGDECLDVAKRVAKRVRDGTFKVRHTSAGERGRV